MRVLLVVVFMAIGLGVAASALSPVFTAVNVANSTTNVSEYGFMREAINFGPLAIWIAIIAGLFWIAWITVIRHHIVGGKSGSQGK